MKKQMPLCGDFDTMPCCYNESEAWVFGEGEWKRINIAEHGTTTMPLSKSAFIKLHGELPPLPDGAFARQSRESSE